MNAFQRKIALRVLGIHLAIVLVYLLFSAVSGCFRPRPKPEIVTFIEFGQPAPDVQVEQVSKMSDPEPPAPTPKPAPTPESAPVPEPVKKPTPKPKPPEPEKPKWKPVDPKDIRKGKKRDAPEPSKPALSEKDIKKALSGIATPVSKSGNPNQFADYYARILDLFYNRWTPPPAAVSGAEATTVRISMQSNGQITKRVKIRSSGDTVYDKTVMDAVHAVSTLPKPPADYPYDFVEVVFTLDR